VVYERIYHQAGATTAMHMPYAALVGLIRDAGKRPVERNSLYQSIREDFSDLPDAVAAVAGPEAGVPAVHAA
jgi:hypothetical protein